MTDIWLRRVLLNSLLWTSLCATAQQFQLRAADGTLSGPFELREGASVSVGTNRATIVNVTRMHGSEREALESGVIVGNTPKAEIIRRAYIVLPSVGPRIESVVDGPDAAQPDAWAAQLKQLSHELGVSWPTGASIRYIPAIGKLVVANTRENLERFERILGQLDLVPFQIEIEVSFVAFDLAQVTACGPSGVTAKALTTLWTNGHAQVLAVPRVLTQSGLEATSKGVTECIYPGGPSALASGTNAASASGGPAVAVGGFETREVGAILAAMPEVSPGGPLINVTLSAELIEDPVWQDYGGARTDSKEGEQKAFTSRPFFHTYSVTTSVSVVDDHPVLIGGGMPTRDRKRVVYAFLTARKIGVRGEPVSTEIDVTRDSPPQP